jgi:hypothetical protein
MTPIMQTHTMSAMRRSIGLLAGWVVSVALAGCMFDAPAQARTQDTCFIGGCSAELCSDHVGMISSCIWHDAYACFRDATCARQPDGACGWTPTPELTSCLASHEPLPGSQP